jgi:uncharacterized protein
MVLVKRSVLARVIARLREPAQFLQVLSGPRQVGKSTLVAQAVADLELPHLSVSADGPTLADATAVSQQWEAARLLARQGPALLVLDEIQKVPGWSEVVKREWDLDRRRGIDLRVVVLGSAPLLVGRGLTESLAGRFELIRVPHWSYAEMHEAFGWDVETYVHFGGYPGAGRLAGDEARWGEYVREALIETTVARDVLLLTRVEKPALLRRLFELACTCSGQVLSYTKMLGQLQDAGNTVTLAHYLDLLDGAGMVCGGLQKYAGHVARRRGSSPKLQVWNNALVTALWRRPASEVRADGDAWGQLVESAVGAHLLNTAWGSGIEVLYWREGNAEVDFVLRRGDRALGIEVKSGRRRDPSGAAAFARAFPGARLLAVGTGGLPLDRLFALTATELLGG